MKFPIGIVASTVSTDLRKSAPRGRELGFDGLQLDLVLAGANLTELSQSGRREIRHLISSNNQQLLSIRTDLGSKGLSPAADIDRAINHIEKAMDATAGLGAKVLCVDLGPLPEPASAPRPKKQIDPAAAGLIIIPSMNEPVEESPSRKADTAFESSVDAALSEIGHRADRYSVMLAFRTELASYAALDRAISNARCPWFGIDLDAVSILRDEWDADEIFSRFGPLIHHVRARDANRGHDRRTRPAVIGSGDTDWPALLARLDEAAYHGALVLDSTELADRVGASTRGLEVLRSI